MVLCVAALFALALTSCGTPSNSIPEATAVVFPELSILETIAKNARVGQVVDSSLVYSTTRLAAFKAGTGANPNPPSQRVDVIVLIGRFICYSCSYPRGAKPPSGRVETFVFVPAHGHVEDFGVVSGRPGPQLGKAYTLPLG